MYLRVGPSAYRFTKSYSWCDSAGYRDSATTLDSQNGDSAGKSRLSYYQVSKKQAQYAMRPRVAGIRSGRFDEENPFMQNSSVLLVQADEGVSVLVVDRIGDIYRSLPRRADVIVTTVGARHKCQQGSGFEPPMYVEL
ncbi:beta subunit of RNA polymerase [Dorcoceras hygrometricum]|uniref:Beta subunit of RNA polymerase n=1 Tax=Dorcoceras hygrometricum TaxID=472368 RepID=A0A2Z7A4R4_9LAMI|nr:beta subunit of RNA polymerase [Dorcoceras hygrometricum]